MANITLLSVNRCFSRQLYLEVNNLSLNGWSPITLRLRLWHIKEVNMVLRPTLSGIRIMVSNQNLSICCCSFLWEDCFFRNRMKWADDKLRSLQKNQLFLCIARSPAFTDFFNISTFEQFFQAAFYGGFAYVRAKCCNIGFFYNAEFLFKHSFDPFRF